ncbi:hypothetical protein F8M41_011727 [Gigaspora margarita]|uniref:Uncharacterized protein n=1 Tax=Gigaspora margarita TaxID=4874 RepID=A0A8H3X0N3_GIGMA|nr:hypothetical protein F8M41_011727 [Gigaspora margarita]
MATVELTKKSRTKAKRRSMPANLGHRTNLLNEEEQANSSTSMQIPTIEENDHHILDLLLNESFSEAELGLDQPLVPTTYTSEEKNSCNNNDIEVIDQQKEIIDDLQGLEESLISNPEKEKINNVLISQDVIESLTSVKHVALIALDSLLRQILADHNSHIKTSEIRSTCARTDFLRQRSFSFSHSPSQNANPELENIPKEERNSWIRSQLLADIAHNATKLSNNNEMMQIDSRQQHSPDVVTLDIIRRQLNSSSSVILSDDYSLACTLAALLGYLYRILELCDSKNSGSSFESELPNTVQTSEEILQPISEDIYSTLHKEVKNLQNQRASLNLHNNVTDERLATWNEIDRLMEIIAGLCRERSNNDPPPKYSHDLTEGDNETVIDPPKYPSVIRNLNITKDNEKTKLDLDNVISAIDRVYCVAPQLNNQRVELSPRQKKKLTAATLSSVIQKLSSGRLEEQRADSSSIIKYQTLNRLVDQINKAAERSFVDQRVELSPRQIRQHEVAKLNGIIERLEKNRMTNQDWHPPEQLLIQDLTRLTNELTKTSTNNIYTSQRYKLSPDQERDMFMNSIFKKVEKMQSYRMDDQDAELPQERAWKEIENLLIKQQYSPSMNYQRATLNPKKTNFN